MTDSIEDRMIEAVRNGVDPEQAYEYVRESMADAADSMRKLAKEGLTQKQADDGAAGVLTLAKDRLWVNAERTVLVRLWNTGTMEVATRETPAHTWGPPTYLTEEQA